MSVDELFSASINTTYVGERREKLVQEVAVSRVNLDDIKASLDGSYSRVLPFLHKMLDLLSRQLVRCTKVFSERDSTGGDNIIWPAADFFGSKCFVYSTADPRRNCARFSASLEDTLAWEC